VQAILDAGCSCSSGNVVYVCLVLVTWVNPARNNELIEMPFGELAESHVSTEGIMY